MTKAQLIAISAIRDLLDVLIIGQLPVLNWCLNAPVIFFHYRFAGPRALFTLLENLPGVETLPCFTAMALAYPDPQIAPKNENPVIDGAGGKEQV